MQTFSFRIKVLEFSKSAYVDTYVLEVPRSEVAAIVGQMPLDDMKKYFAEKGYTLSRTETTEQPNMAVYYRGVKGRGDEIVNAFKKMGATRCDYYCVDETLAYFVLPNGIVNCFLYEDVKKYGRWTELHLPDKPKSILDKKEKEMEDKQ